MEIRRNNCGFARFQVTTDKPGVNTGIVLHHNHFPSTAHNRKLYIENGKRFKRSTGWLKPVNPIIFAPKDTMFLLRSWQGINAMHVPMCQPSMVNPKTAQPRKSDSDAIDLSLTSKLFICFQTSGEDKPFNKIVNSNLLIFKTGLNCAHNKC